MSTVSSASSAPPTQPSTQPPAQPPKRRSRRGLLIKILGAFGLLVMLPVLLAPTLLSLGFVRQKVEEELSLILGTKVEIEDYSLGWFSGLHLEGLAIDNPEGFPQEVKLCRIRELRFDFSLWPWLRNRYEVGGSMDGLEFRLHQKADGQTNLHALLDIPVAEPAPEAEGGKSGKGRKGGSEKGIEAGVLDNLRLDFKLRDGLIEITHEELGTLESLQSLVLELYKPLHSSKVRFLFEADLQSEDRKAPGQLRLQVDADLSLSEPSSLHFKSTGLDLARYKPLLSTCLGGKSLTTFEGLLAGDVRASYATEGLLSVQGALTLMRPHFAGELLQGMELKAQAWTLRPILEVQLDQDHNIQRLKAEDFSLEMGFFNCKGAKSEFESESESESENSLAFDYEADLLALAAMGAPGLEELEAGGTKSARIQGRLTLSPDWNKPPAEIDLRSALTAQATLELDRFEREGFLVQSLVSDLQLDQGRLTMKTRQGTLLNGGPLSLSLESTALDDPTLPVNLNLAWKDGRVAGDAVRLLRYVVPLFAGLDTKSSARLDFASLIGTSLSFEGPLLRQERQSNLEWLNTWKGSGSLRLADGGFTPARQWQSILEFAGQKQGRLDFKDIDTSFKVSQGKVRTELMRLNHKAQSYAVRGEAGMDGSIDYQVALQDLLKGHRDGEKVLKYLGSTPLEARLRGTLDNPSLEAPSFKTLLREAAKGALREEGGKALEKALRDIFKRKKR